MKKANHATNPAILPPSAARQVLSVVLAGGVGQRLFPLTLERAKPAVPFGGKYRIIDIVLSNAVNSGFRRVLVLTQYRAQSLVEHIRRAFGLLPYELDEYVEVVPPQLMRADHWYEGTGDAVFQNLAHIESHRPEQVLILSGDHVYKMDYGKMLASHLANDADVTIACTPIPKADATRFGVMDADVRWRVQRFVEKPKDPPEMPGNPGMSLANMGIYIFDAKLMYDMLEDDAQNEESSHDFGKDILPRMVSEGRRVMGWLFEDENHGREPYFRDIGTLDSYFDANMDLVRVDPLFNLYDPAWPIRTHQGQFPPAKTVFTTPERRGEVLESLVCGGVIVSGGSAVKSVIGPLTYMHSYSHVEESVIFDACDIGRHAAVKRAILDKGVVIAPGVRVGFDQEQDLERGFTVTETGLTIVPKGTHVER